MLDDCAKKTEVKEDDKGNISIGALTFKDKELALINQYNSRALAFANSEDLLYEIKLALEQKIQVF